MKKFTLAVIFILVISFFGFFFYAKSPNLDISEYYQLDKLEYPFRSPRDTLTIVTYNIGYLSGMTNNLPESREKILFDKNLEKAIDVLSNLEADVIGFQEIDFKSERSYYQDQLQEIATSLKYPVSYRSVNWDKRYLPFPYWPPNQQFGYMISGQAVLSVYPASNLETLVLNKPSDSPLGYNSFYIDRLVQMVDLNVGETTIKLMNLHLEAFDEDARVEQAHVVKALFEKYAAIMPVILLGDFNSTPAYEELGNKAMEVIIQATNIESAVSRAMYSADKSDFYTYSSGKPEVMIDYILYNKNFFDCVSARVVTEAGQVSDHLPVTASLVLREQID